MHDFKINKEKKFFIAEMRGRVDLNEGSNIINEFQAMIQTFNVNEYTFILSGKTMSPSSLFVLPMIRKFIKMCYDTPFKKFFFIGDETQNAYAQNLVKSNNSQQKDITITTSMDEAMKLL
jgi:hypothetical protein